MQWVRFLFSTQEQFVEAYLRQFANSDTKPVNITDRYNGNMTSYILRTSAVDIGDFNTKDLIALDVEGSKSDRCEWLFSVECFFLIAI